MTQDCTRWRAQFEKVAEIPSNDAFCIAVIAFDESHDDFEDDPEGAADSEMSYWDDDA